MDKFQSERIEDLKCEFYKVIGHLAIQKNICISDFELKNFEKNLSQCKSEVEAASFIMGGIKRFSIQLQTDTEKQTTDTVNTELIVQQTTDTVNTELIVQQTTDTVNTELIVQTNAVSTIQEVVIVEPDILHFSEYDENTANESNEGAELNIDADESIVTNDSTFDEDVSTGILTNTLIAQIPYVLGAELSTTKANISFFLVYSKLNDIEIGCEFTLRRKGTFPRYECKTCRALCFRNKKAGIETKSCALTMTGNEIKDIKRESHHNECVAEYVGTAYARKVKNDAVVFKSIYGGSSKQVYDTHSKILTVSGVSYNVSAADIAQGFKSFQRAGSALKKSSKRKSAVRPEVVEIVDQVIDKATTQIMKSSPNEAVDFFLIGQDVAAGVIVLGTKFMVKSFFGSKLAMSDGTFKMSPVEYKQSYMLWYIARGYCKDETVERNKAMLSVCFVLKDKKQETYAVAFKILDDYRISQNIPEPCFQEYLTDDEPAVRNVVGELYPNTQFSHCLIHHNQNIVKCLVKHKLSPYIRKCKDDEQLWFYGQLKKILAIPLLQESEMVSAYKLVSEHIMKFVNAQFACPFEIDQFKKFFETVEERYFSPEKLKLICKFNKIIRTTNPIEATHSVFNKSQNIPKNGTVSNFISAMQITDLQYRTIAIDFEKNGASAFAKKRNLYVKQQAVITESTTSLQKGEIDVNKFLEKCAEVMVHPKYYKLIKEATKRFEEEKENENNANDLDSQFNDEFDENIQAIFATENTTSKRVRKLCSKYFGDDWLN